MIENIEDFKKIETKKLLDQYGVPANWLGYKYVATAVPIAVEKIKNDEKIIFKELYKEVAKKHKTTAEKVKESIRYFCNYSNIAKNMDMEKLTNQTLVVGLAMLLIKKFNL